MLDRVEHDPEEAARVRKARVAAAAEKLTALRAAPPKGTYEFMFVRRSPETFDECDFALLRRLVWHYRDRLPGWMRPKLNPDDPIVRELEARNV